MLGRWRRPKQGHSCDFFYYLSVRKTPIVIAYFFLPTLIAFPQRACNEVVGAGLLVGPFYHHSEGLDNAGLQHDVGDP